HPVDVDWPKLLKDIERDIAHLYCPPALWTPCLALFTPLHEGEDWRKSPQGPSAPTAEAAQRASHASALCPTLAGGCVISGARMNPGGRRLYTQYIPRRAISAPCRPLPSRLTPNAGSASISA